MTGAEAERYEPRNWGGRTRAARQGSDPAEHFLFFCDKATDRLRGLVLLGEGSSGVVGARTAGLQLAILALEDEPVRP